MKQKEYAEGFFKKACAAANLDWQVIPVQREQTPDGILTVDGHRIVVEIKQISNNQEDLDSWGSKESRVITGKRVKQKIHAATNQLLPGDMNLVVLFNATLWNYTGTHSVTTALFGGKKVTFGLTNNEITSAKIDHKYEDMAFNSKSNTRVSALVILHVIHKEPDEFGDAKEFVLRIFPNPHAEKPIPIETLRKIGEVFSYEYDAFEGAIQALNDGTCPAYNEREELLQ